MSLLQFACTVCLYGLLVQSAQPFLWWILSFVCTSDSADCRLLITIWQEQDEPIAYSFSAEISAEASVPVSESLYIDLFAPGLKNTEETIKLVYAPQAQFRVRAVGRCSSEIPGHDGSIIAAQFAPFGASRLATGSGDCSARIWDTDTETPLFQLKGHSNWVSCISWSPDGRVLATGSMDCSIRCWNPKKGVQIGQPLKRHTKPIMSIAWEPFHLALDRCKNSTKRDCNGNSASSTKAADQQNLSETVKPNAVASSELDQCAAPGQSGAPLRYRLVSGSKDFSVRIFDVSLGAQTAIFSGHTGPVTCVRWGGTGWIYSSSYDRTIKIWDADTGTLVHNLLGHAARINHLALSTDHVLRVGPYGHDRIFSESGAVQRFANVIKMCNGIERLISVSDDLQTFLWHPSRSKKPIAKMHGHQQVVNHAAFSPDGRYIATASFDGSVRLWNAADGKFIATLRGHVASVYQCAWSADSRLLVSSSKDTTLKVWDIRTRKLKSDLPGHKDQVFAVDWSADGDKVASGGADKMVRIWRH